MRLIIKMSPLNVNDLYKLMDICGDEAVLGGEEGRIRGIFNILDYIVRSEKKHIDLIRYILSLRIDGDCKDFLRGLLSDVVNKVGDKVFGFLTRDFTRFFSEIRSSLESTVFDSSSYYVIFDRYDGCGDFEAFKRLGRGLKNICRDLHLLSLPGLGYFLNVIHYLPFTIDYADRFRELFSGFDGSLIFLDSYDAMLARKILRLGDRVVSISDFLIGLLDRDQVYLEKTVEFKINIFRPCSECLVMDLNNYIYILDGMPNLHYIISKKCVPSLYPHSIKEYNRGLDVDWMKMLFDDEASKVFLTVDPYFYPILSEAAKGEAIVPGYVPNLIVRVMRRV